MVEINVIDVTKEYIEEWRDKQVNAIEQVKQHCLNYQKPEKLSHYAGVIEAHKGAIEALNNHPISVNKELIFNRLKRIEAEDRIGYDNKIIAINEKYQSIANTYISQVIEANKAYNRQVEQQVIEGNKIYNLLESKRAAMSEYENKIIDLCSYYGITSSDISMDNSTFSVDELNRLYDSYLEYLDKEDNEKDFFGIVRKVCNKDETRLAFVCLFILLALTPIFDIAMVALFVSMVIRQAKSSDKIKYYSVLYGLLYNVNPTSMEGYKNTVPPELLLPTEITDEMTENDPNAIKLVEQWDAELAQVGEAPPERYPWQAEWVNETQTINIMCDGVEATVRRTLKDAIIEINKLISQLEEQYNDLSNGVYLLGEKISEVALLDTNLRLGIVNNVEEETVDFELKNILIRDIKDADLKRKFLQVLVCNFMSNVQIGKASFIIYDPNNMGMDLIDFLDDETERYFSFKNEGLDKILIELKQLAMTNMKIIGSGSINDYNRVAIESERVTVGYKFLFILSQPKKVEEDEALKEFMTYSAEKGIIIVMMSNANIPNTFVFNKPFEGVEHPYDIDLSTFAQNFKNLIKETFKVFKPKPLTWSIYNDRVVPKEKWWTGHTDTYIDLFIGHLNGDITDTQSQTLGHDGDIHGLAAGTTGAGKSILMNNIIANLCTYYSPKDLELWLIDYKAVEFALYLNNNAHPHTLPHLKTCLCTTDGAYAKSVYKALYKELLNRQKIGADIGYRSLKEYNTAMRNAGTPEKCMPRILIINDEFQVIFRTADSKDIEEIKTDLANVTALGRAWGVHQLYTSQALKGTLSADILAQFTLRIGLRLDENMSMELMGAKTSSSIVEKNGFLYLRKNGHVEADKQQRFWTPYISEDEISNLIIELEQRAKDEGMPDKKVVQYDENDKWYEKDLLKVWNDNREQIDKMGSGLFILGERMTYDPNNVAPVNKSLARGNNSNMVAVFRETEDFVNFFNTMITNINQNKGERSIIIHAGTKDYHYLCHVDEHVDEPFREKCMPPDMEAKELLGLLEQIIAAREKSGAVEVPVYCFLLGWDKMVGFGIAKDFDIADKLQKLMYLCGKVNIHIIMINASSASLNDKITAACNLLVAGACDEASSYMVLGGKQACLNYELKNGWFFIKEHGDMARAKLYRYEQDRVIEKVELVL